MLVVAVVVVERDNGVAWCRAGEERGGEKKITETEKT
jgi:hypothetical protein